MKLTPRSQGFRFSKKGWRVDQFLDVKKVGKGFYKQCVGVNEKGEALRFETSEAETDWIKLGSTTELKRKKK